MKVSYQPTAKEAGVWAHTQQPGTIIHQVTVAQQQAHHKAVSLVASAMQFTPGQYVAYVLANWQL